MTKRIAVLILTRGRPGGLIAAVRAYDALASGDVPVQYVLCCDDDDWAIDHALRLSGGLPVTISSNPRPDALGWAWNRGAENADAWDYAFLTGDDVVPLSWHWDRVIAAETAPAFAWREMGDPTNVTYPVLSRRWVDAVGRAVPECFPFWFNDTWLAEVHRLAFGRALPIIDRLAVGGRRGHTREMRELAFWFRYFAATRPQRLREAARVAEAFGHVMPDPAGALQMMRQWDAIQASRVPAYTAAFGADLVPPTARYLRIRAAAEAEMQGVAA